MEPDGWFKTSNETILLASIWNQLGVKGGALKVTDVRPQDESVFHSVQTALPFQSCGSCAVIKHQLLLTPVHLQQDGPLSRRCSPNLSSDGILLCDWLKTHTVTDDFIHCPSSCMSDSQLPHLHTFIRSCCKKRKKLRNSFICSWRRQREWGGFDLTGCCIPQIS